MLCPQPATSDAAPMASGLHHLTIRIPDYPRRQTPLPLTYYYGEPPLDQPDIPDPPAEPLPASPPPPPTPPQKERPRIIAGPNHSYSSFRSTTEGSAFLLHYPSGGTVTFCPTWILSGLSSPLAFAISPYLFGVP